MRPLKQGPSFLPFHVYQRNGVYYYRINVPVDILHHFPTSEIKKSLKTKDSKHAKVLAVSMEYKVQQTFTLLRSGMLQPELAKEVVEAVVPSRQVQAVSRGNLLSGMIMQYIQVKEPHWTPKTKMEMTGVFRLLLDIVGDTDVAGITKQCMIDLRAKLMRLPANLYKRYPGQTISQILDTPDVKPMSTTSVNKHVGGMSALLGYCAGEGVVRANCALGLKVSGKKRVDEERHAYSLADLKRIAENLPQDKETAERYWIPLLGCYTGMRLNEICQLYVDDVLKVEDVWCISVNDKRDKRLKNPSSERVIPIHPILLEQGFLKYVEQCKDGQRLWPNLTWCKVNGYSNLFGKWYQRFNREHVTEDAKKVFHSFRHLVADTLKQARVQDSVIAELMGHSHGSHTMTMGRYGKRYQPKVLLEALMQLDYRVDIPGWE